MSILVNVGYVKVTDCKEIRWFGSVARFRKLGGEASLTEKFYILPK